VLPDTTSRSAKFTEGAESASTCSESSNILGAAEDAQYNVQDEVDWQLTKMRAESINDVKLTNLPKPQSSFSINDNSHPALSYVNKEIEHTLDFNVVTRSNSGPDGDSTSEKPLPTCPVENPFFTAKNDDVVEKDVQDLQQMKCLKDRAKKHTRMKLSLPVGTSAGMQISLQCNSTVCKMFKPESLAVLHKNSSDENLQSPISKNISSRSQIKPESTAPTMKATIRQVKELVREEKEEDLPSSEKKRTLRLTSEEVNVPLQRMSVASPANLISTFPSISTAASPLPTQEQDKLANESASNSISSCRDKSNNVLKLDLETDHSVLIRAVLVLALLIPIFCVIFQFLRIPDNNI